MNRRLRRVSQHSWVGGVCGGAAYWLGFPAWIVRLALAVAVFGYGVGLGVYILLWIFMPEWTQDPADYEAVTEE